MTDIYFTRVTKDAEFTFPYLLEKWPYGNLKGRITLRTSLGRFLFLGWDNYECMFNGFCWDIYGDHVVSCAGIIGIKHRHNVVRDALVESIFVRRFQLVRKLISGWMGEELEEDTVTLLKQIQKFSMA
nr:hypothetical protein [Tanacetum cinerariifolium]